MDVLNRVFILPLRYFLEIIFKFLLRNSNNNVLITIIGLSAVVSIITLPIYLKSENESIGSSAKKAELKKWVKHINKSFSGDERVMVRAFLYSEMGGRTSKALVGLVFNLFQILFFIAAYSFLSGYFELNPDIEIWGIRLSEADGLLAVNGYNVNILPLIMTAVNILAALIYCKRLSDSSFMQSVVIAFIFLILLYKSPAGMVLYWLSNNLFTLLKNIVISFKKRNGSVRYIESVEQDIKDTKITIWIHLAFLLFMGVVIPANTIASSPTDFIDIYHYVSPFYYIGVTFLSYLGLFILYGLMFFCCLEKWRKFWAWLITSLFVQSCLNYALWGRTLGNISKEMVYDNSISYTAENVTAGIIITISVFLIIYYIFLNYKKIIFKVAPALFGAMFIFGAFRVVQVWMILNSYSEIREINSEAEGEALFGFSKKGQNVLIIMLDRAVGALLPYIFEEHPGLVEKYEGFVFYPDTLSMGGYTRLGQPALYGGYDYCYEGMKESIGKTYAEKCDEELRLLPMLFSKKGYEVYMSDDAIGGIYHNTPWNKIYNDLPGSHTYTLDGKYAEYAGMIDIDIERNFVLYSLFRSCMPGVAEKIYDRGEYLAIHKPSMINKDFYNAYTALKELPDITYTDYHNPGALVMICSKITHSPCILQRPDYVPAIKVDNSCFEDPEIYTISGKKLEFTGTLEKHYYVYVAAIEVVGKWMDKLRELGVYDNTRIIIAADHGWNLGLIDINIGGEDVTKMNPLLMVKDFGCNDEFSVSEEYMTNADVPYLAINGIIDNAVNPYTGNAINMDKKSNKLLVPFSPMTKINPEGLVDGKPDIDVSDRPIYTVHDSIFEEKNWEVARP